MLNLQCATLLLYCCTFTCLFAQQAQLSLRHYTTDDGLPSSEVHEVLQDRRGYLWFGTDNGMSRFNGYEFRNYSAVDGLTDPVIFALQEDHRGWIWMQTLSQQLFYYEPTQDTIYAFWGNREIKKLQGKFTTSSSGFQVDLMGIVHATLGSYGILKFLPDSTIQPFRPSFVCQIVYQSSDAVLTSSVAYPINSPQEKYYQNHWVSVDSVPVVFYQSNITEQQILPNFPKNYKAPMTWYLSESNFLITTNQYLHYYQTTHRIWTIPFPDYIASFFQNQQKELFLGMNHSGGCRKYANLEALRQNHYETILPGYTVTGILQDREGGYWFTTVQNGVFYCPDPSWQLYNAQSGYDNDYAASVALKNEQEWFVSLNTGQVYYQNANLQQLENLVSPDHYCDDILYDNDHQRLWASLGMLRYWEHGNWKQATGIHPVTKNTHGYAIRSLWQDKNEQAIWGVGVGGFIKISAGKTSADFISNYLSILPGRTLAVFKNKDGKVWIGRLDGLHEFREAEKKLYPPELDYPAFQLRIEALAGLPDTTLVVGTKGAGILLYKGKTIQQITAKDGLTSDMIETLHVDARGNIWAGTLNGLNKITLKDKDFSIEHFTTAHGLPSNEINKIVTRNGKVWVATTRGLVIFHDDYKKNTVSPKPLLELFQVNDQPRNSHQNWGLRHSENNLTLQYASLQFRNAGKVTYRYRLKTQTDWTYTREHRLNFAALEPATYTFEIQAQNEDGIWSDSTTLPFEIRPAWWRTGWFYGSLGLLAALAGYWYYRARLNAIRQKASIAAQITDLERKALAAQMNPHFVFNCLNSIQLLIREKAEDRALQYLARFAKLIRSLLEFSRKGKVTIQEETQALEHYLELEKLRFKEQLSYNIQIADNIDPFEIEIPPLLIQPFVENAIKHGLSGLENGGLVRISFEMKGKDLLVNIEDNGKGFDVQQESASRHRSMGIELTRRRLALANGTTNSADLIIESSEKQSGTQVQLRIQVNKEIDMD